MINVETTSIGSIPAVSLEERRDTLYARLESGFLTIERAATNGKDVSRWEKAWLGLLREYEEVCDQIASREQTDAVESRELVGSVY